MVLGFENPVLSSTTTQNLLDTLNSVTIAGCGGLTPMTEQDVSEFDQIVNQNLAERKRLANSSIQKLYSRKQMEQGFLECFELIGGVPRLALWANDPANYGDFLKLLMKFTPKDTTETLGRVLNYQSNVPASPLNPVQEIEEGDFSDS